MSKAIKIKLVPSSKDKIYQPLPDFVDLHILMNKLHLQSVNKALEEDEDSRLGELEMKVYELEEEITTHQKEESTLNVLSDCLEDINKTIKKSVMANKKTALNKSNFESFNKIIEESSLDKILIKLNLPDSTDYVTLNSTVEDNIKIINGKKALLNLNIENLLTHKNKIRTLQENINSSNADIDTLEVAFKNLII